MIHSAIDMFDDAAQPALALDPEQDGKPMLSHDMVILPFGGYALFDTTGQHAPVIEAISMIAPLRRRGCNI